MEWERKNKMTASDEDSYYVDLDIIWLSVYHSKDGWNFSITGNGRRTSKSAYTTKEEAMQRAEKSARKLLDEAIAKLAAA